MIPKNKKIPIIAVINKSVKVDKTHVFDAMIYSRVVGLQLS